MHPLLAFLYFFRMFFGAKLPADAVKYLPEGAVPKALPEGKASKTIVVEKIVEREIKPKADDKPRVATAAHHKDGALAFLALLQREGRLVDFLREPLDGFTDEDIGATARDIHRGCRKVLDQHLTFEPVMPGAEEERVTVPKVFDPAEIRLIGEAKGEPPFKGTLRHHGWRVVEAKLPTLAEGIDRTVIAPAEVELSAS